MRWFFRLSTIAAPTMRATTISEYNQAFFSGDPLPDLWLAALSGSGIAVTPDLAMMLSAYRCGVETIAYDLATLPLRAFATRADGGADLLQPTSAAASSIRSLMYRLQWQPNQIQTSAEFFASMIAQLKMRNRAYAEIVAGPTGFADQLLPRHPDRVTPEKLPSGRLRYKLTEAASGPRYVTQDEMFVIRDISTDGGVSVLSSIAYGANTFGTALAAEKAAGQFFKTGMTAAMLATYNGGQKDDEDEAALHRAISRYAAGVENSFGLMLVPDDVKISNLAIEPEKAQMMAAREWSVYEVARELRISPRKLMAGKSATYASAYQDSIDHVVNCLRPIAVLIQQSVQRDLVLEQDVFRFIFHLGELLKGDPAQMGDFIQKLIASRAMSPSEVRMTYLDLNPDPHLDQLSESDNKPGTSTTPAASASARATSDARLHTRAVLTIHDQALRCLRRERAAVEKLAKKHADDVPAWHRALREFYQDHQAFVAETLRLHPTVARGYAAQHGAEVEAQGAVVFEADGWERFEAEELTTLALSEGDTIEAWFERRLTATRPLPAPITVTATTQITTAPVTVDARTTVEPAQVSVHTPQVTIADGAVQVTVAPAAAPAVTVPVTIAKGAVQVAHTSTLAQPKLVKKTIARDKDKQITGVTEEYQ